MEKTAATRKIFPVAARKGSARRTVRRVKTGTGKSGCRSLAAENRRYLRRGRLGGLTASCLRLAAIFTPYARKSLAEIGICAGCIAEGGVENRFHAHLHARGNFATLAGRRVERCRRTRR